MKLECRSVLVEDASHCSPHLQDRPPPGNTQAHSLNQALLNQCAPNSVWVWTLPSNSRLPCLGVRSFKPTHGLRTDR